MAVVRFKYRPPAIQPELADGRENATLSLAKKEKIVEEDPYGGDLIPTRKKDTIFLASHTQVKRQEIWIQSNEEEYRRKHNPTVFERIETQKEWAKDQLREARFEAEREAIKMRIDRAARQKAGESIPAEEDEILEDIENQLQLISAEDEREMEVNKKKITFQEYANQILEIKEKKVLTTRSTDHFHKTYTLWERRKLAFKISMGYTGKKEKGLEDITYILPWLIIGRREVSSNMQILLKLDITHILNVTHDAPNLYNQHFVYEKIPIRDSVDSDIGKYFDSIINFIDRVEACKGRILVHCNAGASRAPTAVIAYLLAKKRITLEDAYNYVVKMRPVVYPNKRFLFQLAMLEVRLFESCSVYYHKHWRFYEFNVFRSQLVEERERLGLFKTVMTLYENFEEEEDLLSQTQGGESKSD